MTPRGLLLVALALALCRCATTPATGRAPPQAAAPAPKARPAATPPASDEDTVVELGQFNDTCRGTRRAQRECRAQGPTCRLKPPPLIPVRDRRCENRGARCEDDKAPPSTRGQPCWCSCSQRFVDRQRAVDAAHQAIMNERSDEQHRAACRTVTNLRTGKTEEVCVQPELPR